MFFQRFPTKRKWPSLVSGQSTIADVVPDSALVVDEGSVLLAKVVDATVVSKLWQVAQHS